MNRRSFLGGILALPLAPSAVPALAAVRPLGMDDVLTAVVKLDAPTVIPVKGRPGSFFVPQWGKSFTILPMTEESGFLGR